MDPRRLQLIIFPLRINVENPEQIDIEWNVKQCETMGLSIAKRAEIQRQIREELDPNGGEDIQWG